MGKKAIGLDVGTTTVGAVLIDDESGEAEISLSEPNCGFLPSSRQWEKTQDPERTAEQVQRIADRLIGTEKDVSSIGVTGQMHGILYLDRDGKAVSSLRTWQDGRAGEPLFDGKNACEVIAEKTGYTVHAGYGLATFFTDLRLGLVPENAVSLCTVHDYVIMRLTGRKKPLIHVSDAASLGLFDLKNLSFDRAAIRALGVDETFLPEVTGTASVAGEYRGIPVTAAIGDNQAAFLGSVSERDGVLVNIGTGSQISWTSGYSEDLGECELRPLTDGNYLTVGSALCGGRAYALLERFFRSFAEALGVGGEQYALMERLAAEAEEDCGGLRVDPRFAGSRAQPALRGSVTNADTSNLTPGNLSRAVLTGIAEELRAFLPASAATGTLVGSGNAIRKNPVLARIIEQSFSCTLLVPVHREEAAYGAALFGRAGTSGIPLEEVRRLIRYQ